MRCPNTTLIRLCILAPALLSAFSALAQEERWYRVELLVFSQDSQAGRMSETWEPRPVLRYPDNGRFLVDLKATTNLSNQYDGVSELNALGHQTITITPPKSGLELPAHTADSMPAVGSDALPPAIENQATPQTASTETPSPFRLLPHSELEFRGKAAYMQRTGRYKTLFHETWVQAMLSDKETAPIIIDRSGDTETWPTLQGSVKLYLSRYLHLETNLWLNTDGSYLPEQWNMPAPPLGPKSLTINYPPEAEPETVETIAIEEPHAISSMMDEGDNKAMEAVVQGPVSPWRHAILLQGERRMRSTEVHYIDHPMLGVVVKISPLTKQDLKERAALEAAQADSGSDNT